MARNSTKQRIFTVLRYRDEDDPQFSETGALLQDLIYEEVLALNEDEAVEICGGVENVLDIFEGTFEHPADLDDDEDELDYVKAGASLYTVVHFEDGELMYTDVIAHSSSEACSWFNAGDIYDVYEAALGYMVG